MDVTPAPVGLSTLVNVVAVPRPYNDRHGARSCSLGADGAVGSITMDDVEPGLFEWFPEPEAKPPSRRNLPSGRNRETWICAVTADVTIVDTGAVDEAIAQAAANGLMIGWNDDSDDNSDDESPAPPDVNAEPARRLDQLAWLIWPTDGMEELTEADAFHVLLADCEMVSESANRGIAKWSVTIKLRNVDQLRRVATEAHPDDAALIEESLAIAWQRAADPYAPLRSIPGITWQPRTVDVEHLPARPARNQ